MDAQKCPDMRVLMSGRCTLAGIRLHGGQKVVLDVMGIR